MPFFKNFSEVSPKKCKVLAVFTSSMHGIYDWTNPMILNNRIVVMQGGQTFRPEGRICDYLATEGPDVVRFTQSVLN